MQLHHHPANPPRSDFTLDAEVARSESGLKVTYTLTGDTGALVIPAPVEPSRTDHLWRITCFELFLRGEGTAYREYNFSPSGEWAAYSFESWREGMREIPADIVITASKTDQSLVVTVALATDLAEVTRLGIAAVVEERDGTKSNWALAHPPGKADFHDDACFALRLADIGAA